MGSRGMAPCILNLCTTWSLVLKFTPRSFAARKIASVTFGLEVRWAPQPVWTRQRTYKSLATFRFPCHPARIIVTKMTELFWQKSHSCTELKKTSRILLHDAYHQQWSKWNRAHNSALLCLTGGFSYIGVIRTRKVRLTPISKGCIRGNFSL
jgi:hypothetical protein